jgi:hypothetical protein
VWNGPHYDVKMIDILNLFGNIRTGAAGVNFIGILGRNIA